MTCILLLLSKTGRLDRSFRRRRQKFHARSATTTTRQPVLRRWPSLERVRKKETTSTLPCLLVVVAAKYWTDRNFHASLVGTRKSRRVLAPPCYWCASLVHLLPHQLSSRRFFAAPELFKMVRQNHDRVVADLRVRALLVSKMFVVLADRCVQSNRFARYVYLKAQY
jgi:hypothetical protein